MIAPLHSSLGQSETLLQNKTKQKTLLNKKDKLSWSVEEHEASIFIQ